jgi:signal transduction histidine kinase
MSGYLFAAACVVLLGVGYGAGRAALSPPRTTAVAVVACAILAAQLVTTREAARTAVAGYVSACLVFVLLPLLAGRYVAQQRTARDQERLRIARDMHDSLGRALSLAAVQAAVLEVSALPAEQRAAATRLGTAIRASVTELHEIVAVLRVPARGFADTGGLVEEFRGAGADVSVRSDGRPRPLPKRADEAAYRVLEEGLTNAIRHAPGQPVHVTMCWRPSSLTLTIANPVTTQPATQSATPPSGPADAGAYSPGAGLDGLTVRLREAGGALGHELRDGRFLLRASLPLTRRARLRAGLAGHRIGLGFAAGFVLLVVVPATILLGVA